MTNEKWYENRLWESQKEAQILEDKIAQLTAERDEWKNKFTDALACNGRLVEQVEQLTAERNKLAEAVGLMTTLKPTMVVDSAHPVEMALEVLEYIAQLTAERDEWRADAEQLAKHHLSITKANLFHCSYCGYITTDDDGIMVHQDNCPITLHRALVEKYKKEVVR